MLIKDELDAHIRAFEGLEKKLITDAAALLITVFKQGGKALICGNGGSAADAQHFAAELIGRFRKERPALPALSLSTDTSALTAIGNDYGFKEIFARQILGLGKAGDVLIVFSTSGKSENILEAITAARKKDMAVLGLTGKSGGKMEALCDLTIKVNSNDTPRIQELHIFIIHCICAMIDEAVVGS